MRYRWLACLLLGVMVGAGAASGRPPADASGGGAAPGDQGTRVGISTALFDDLNGNDVRASMKVWLENLSTKKRIPMTTDVELLAGVEEMRKRGRSRSVDLIVVTGKEAIDLQADGNFAPLFAVQRSGSVYSEYALLARGDGRVKRIQDLGGGMVLIDTTGKTNCLAKEWFETLLHETGLRGGDPAPVGFREVSKLSRAVLPVFFGQVQACVVNRSGFKTMVEMNPQLGKDLTTLAVSPGIAGTVICMRTAYFSRYKDPLIDAMRLIHEDPQGQQIMTVLQFEKLVPFQPSYLEAADALVRKYALMASAMRRSGPAVRDPIVHTPPEPEGSASWKSRDGSRGGGR